MPFGFINLFHQYLLCAMCMEQVLWGFNRETQLLLFGFMNVTLGREHLIACTWKLTVEKYKTSVAYAHRKW